MLPRLFFQVNEESPASEIAPASAGTWKIGYLSLTGFKSERARYCFTDQHTRALEIGVESTILCQFF